MTPAVQLGSLILMIFFGGIAAIQCDATQKTRAAHARSIRQTAAATDALETCVSQKQALIDKYEAEEAMREKDRERIDAAMDTEPDPILVSIGRIACQRDLSNWTAEVENKAGVPHRTLKAFQRSFNGEGPEPKLTRRQKRRLLRFMKKPLPECVGNNDVEFSQMMSKERAERKKEEGR